LGTHIEKRIKVLYHPPPKSTQAKSDFLRAKIDATKEKLDNKYLKLAATKQRIQSMQTLKQLLSA
jgi:hypothetical protein